MKLNKNNIYLFNYTGLTSFWTVKSHKNFLYKKRNTQRRVFNKKHIKILLKLKQKR